MKAITTKDTVGLGCKCKDCLANPTKEQEMWYGWIETVFWNCSGPVKHGGWLWPDLCSIGEADGNYGLYFDLAMKRTHKIGGDELHCIREQIYIDYDIPAAYKRLWPRG
jgi:hypothetical protein